MSAPRFTQHRRVEFADTDMAGVMHFAAYYRYMEAVEHAWFRALGLSVVSHDGDGRISWPRAATKAEYFAPARFEDVLEMSLSVVRLGKRSLTHEVSFVSAGRVIARTEATIVCCRVGADTFESVDIPDDVRRRIEAGPPRNPRSDRDRID